MAQKTRKKDREDQAPAPEGPTAVAEPAPETVDGRAERGFPIVGVGASAGGLEAFTEMLHALPGDTGFGFVLVQHLAPSHASMLTEILSRSTKMSVREVQNEMAVEPNHIYVIPPGQNMVISEGVLKLSPRKEIAGQHRPVDHFLRSLAEDLGHKSIGVILSGTATDGTLGLEAVKAEGGITFAQDDTAQHDSMPRSAIAAGCVDLVLPPAEIAKEIARISRHPHVRPAAEPKRADGSVANLSYILTLLRQATGVDFTQYKYNTLYRRISRRMVLHKIEQLADYVGFLQSAPGEVENLYQDILISVTSFFRDRDTFEALKKDVFPKLVKDRFRQDPVRVWVVGCSTGEEAYSMAISFAEFIETSGKSFPIQIFATDLNGIGIEKARQGAYPKSVAQDVVPERLRRYFIEIDGVYRINKAIRDVCVFARHNVLGDPPFARMDLIACRNLLIYLEPGLQQKLIPILHYSLRPEGYLMLGSSETIGSYRDLFELENAKHKIYVKKIGSPRQPVTFPVGRPTTGRAAPLEPMRGLREPGGPADVLREADRVILSRYAPSGVLVNSDLEILQFRGDTGPYLVPAPGRASLNLLKMLREGLLVAVRGALHKAKREEAPVREERLRCRSNGGDIREVDVQVIPIRGVSVRESSFLILFEEHAGTAAPPPEPPKPSVAPPESAEAELARVKQELAATREYLQSVIEQQEAANEELQSANEEVQSTNEELQSINEELETSKEEIQSSNEELSTVNEELQNRNVELSQTNSDLMNLFGSVQMAIVFLGRDLRIRRLTQAAEKMLNLIPADVGRPIMDIKLNVDLPHFEELLTEVLDTVAPKEFEVQDKNGRWYSIRLRPYRTLENKIDGIVVVLVDVDRLKRAREYAESIVAEIADPLLVLDRDLRVQTASQSFYETFRLTTERVEGRIFHEVSDWNPGQLRPFLDEIREDRFPVDGFEIECTIPPLGPRTMLLSARKPAQGGLVDGLILVNARDISDRKQLELNLSARLTDLADADRSKNEFLAMLAHELRNPLAPLRNAVEVLKAPGADRGMIEWAREMMARQIQNMSRMIDDLLDISRITQGKIELQRERIKLATVLTRAAEIVWNEIRTRGQELSISLPSESVWVEGDAARLEQLFGNLLGNASKYTPNGGHLWLNAEQSVLAKGDRRKTDRVVVRVRDDGIGIPEDMLMRVFDLFVQGKRSLDRPQGGLGIGLTLARRVAEMHGGSVEVRSDGSGKGSEFVVSLPVMADVEGPPPRAQAPPQERPAPVRTGNEAPAQSQRILIVDDNVDMAKGLGMLFELSGNKVRIAHDGELALEIAKTFRPEVVLLDVGLPGMDGYDLARQLRKQPGMEKAFLVALTGYGQDEDRRRALEAGFDRHLTKPVDPQILEKVLSRSEAPS